MLTPYVSSLFCMFVYDYASFGIRPHILDKQLRKWKVFIRCMGSKAMVKLLQSVLCSFGSVKI